MHSDRPPGHPGGESQAQTLERLMAQHGDGLMRLCFMMLGDRSLAEDAVQESFLRAWRAWPRFRGDSSEYTWLTRIAINCCHSMRKKAWFRLEDRQAEPPEDPVEQQMPDDSVIRAVMALKPRYREPILLYYYQGLPVKEIAGILNTAVSTISVRLMRARELLKGELKEWYFDE